MQSTHTNLSPFHSRILVRVRGRIAGVATSARVPLSKARKTGLLLNLASLSLAGVVCVVVWQRISDQASPAEPRIATIWMEDGAAGAAATYREGATPLGGLAELYREQQQQRSASPPTVFIVATEEQAKQLRAFIASVENTSGHFDVDPAASSVLVATEDQTRDFASEIVRQNQIRVWEGLPEVQVLDMRECAVMRKRVTCWNEGTQP